MGVYDTYGHVQLKVGPCQLHEIEVGDDALIDDGIYAGYGGFVVVDKGVFIAVFKEKQMFDKWGNEMEVDIDEGNVVTQAVKDHQKGETN